jgi:hypothetical protein
MRRRVAAPRFGGAAARRGRPAPLQAKVAALGTVLAAGASVVLAVTSAVGTDARRLPPCRQAVDVGPLGQSVTCRTASAILSIGAEGSALAAADTQVRVLRTQLRRGALRARLRVRNAGAVPRQTERLRIYLATAATKVRTTLPVRRVSPGEARTLALRFPLPRATRQSVRRGARTELAVVPWRATGTHDDVERLIVVRLRPQAP